MELIQQREYGDCAVASLAMLLEMDYETVAKLHKEYNSGFLNGVPVSVTMKIYREQTGKDIRYIDIKNLYKNYEIKSHCLMIVQSKNYEGKTHMLYFDGEKIYDPSPFRKYTDFPDYDKIDSILEPIFDMTK